MGQLASCTRWGIQDYMWQVTRPGSSAHCLSATGGRNRGSTGPQTPWLAPALRRIDRKIKRVILGFWDWSQDLGTNRTCRWNRLCSGPNPVTPRIRVPRADGLPGGEGQEDSPRQRAFQREAEDVFSWLCNNLQTQMNSNETKTISKKAKLPFPLFLLWCLQFIFFFRPQRQIKRVWTSPQQRSKYVIWHWDKCRESAAQAHNGPTCFRL